MRKLDTIARELADAVRACEETVHGGGPAWHTACDRRIALEKEIVAVQGHVGMTATALAQRNKGARYVAVPAWQVDEIETLGGIGNMACGRDGSVYAIGRGVTAADALDAAGDETSVIYDLETGEEVQP